MGSVPALSLGRSVFLGRSLYLCVICKLEEMLNLGNVSCYTSVGFLSLCQGLCRCWWYKDHTLALKEHDLDLTVCSGQQIADSGAEETVKLLSFAIIRVPRYP